MNKKKFLNIIQSHVFTDNDEVDSFQKIADRYPYSQIFHTLIAKHHSAIKSTETKNAIQRAAIYATDRVVLKKIIESAVPPFKEGSENFKSHSLGISDVDQLRKHLFTHLQQLQESKKPFLTQESVPLKKKGGKATSSKTKNKSSIKKKVKVKEKSIPDFPDGNKRKNINLSQEEQVNLMEKFIRSPPKITKGKVKSAPGKKKQEDLSKDNTKIEENFASENLAQILIKQGNKKKAVKIYKKLIWKFPQKKAYFATQIAELKK